MCADQVVVGAIALERLLPRWGVCSRRQARAWIAARRVSVNGRPVADAGQPVDPQCDALTLDGRSIEPAAPVTFKLHKPLAMLTTLSDPQHRPTIAALLPRGLPYVVPVGRLDWDSSGLLLLSNDGVLGHRILTGEEALVKRYEVEVAGQPDDATFDPLRRGSDLGDHRCQPASVVVIERMAYRTRLLIEIREGRRRQIRRSLHRVGLRVRALHRSQVGPIGIGELAPGAIAPLTASESAALYAAVGLAPPTGCACDQAE